MGFGEELVKRPRRPGFAFLVIFYFWPFFLGPFGEYFLVFSRVFKQIQEEEEEEKTKQKQKQNEQQLGDW